MTKLVFRQFSKITGKQLYWNHQWEFIKDTKTRNLALVCGFGAGKTYAFLKKTLYHLINSPTDESIQKAEKGIIPYPVSAGWVVYPTLKDAKTIFKPAFCEILTEKGINWKFNSELGRITTDYGTIDLKTMDEPDKLVSANLSYCGIDEFDIVNTDKALLVYQKLLGRLRAREDCQLYITTTPEGFKATYQIFVEQAERGSKKLIKGRTQDNKALPSSFIDSLKDLYDEKQLLAYMSGEFVNMKYQSAYRFFDREKHLAKTKIDLNISLQVMLCFDFNVEPYCLAICQDNAVYNREKRQNSINEKGIKVIDEIILKGGKSNSYDIVAEIIARIPKEANIVLFGDASGNSHKTSAVSTDWEIIMQGLKPHFRSLEFAVERSNPPIEHRVNTVNYHLRKNHIEINPHCEFLINDLEQVSYKENGQFDTSNKMLTHISDAFGYYIYRKFSIYNRQY
jgi:hypothetical protein